MNDYLLLGPEEQSDVLSYLKREPAKHALVLQNLTEFAAASRFYFRRTADSLAFIHVSGHPAHRQGRPVFVIDGDTETVTDMLQTLKPNAPFAVRESAASLEPAVRTCYPHSTAQLEYRMDVTHATFRRHHSGKARTLNETDLPALCAFMGAPPQAAPRLAGWVNGARVFLGIEENGELRAIGSSMVCLPEVFNIVSIETHKDHRGKGYATELTSALVERCLEYTPLVCLTVFADNPSAIRVYEKLGFQKMEERIWMDCANDVARLAKDE